MSGIQDARHVRKGRCAARDATPARVPRVTAWPEDVERVASFLRAAAAEGRIEEFDHETASAADAALAVGCEPGEIVKSLVVVGDGRAFLALIPGDRRGDLEKIASAAGAADVRMAKPNEVVALTGFAPGAVAPFPLPGIERVLVDRNLLACDGVWVGAGSPRHMAVLPTPELVRLTKAAPADLVSEI
jgi:prolyl-tRNA editing enzyme YbaK/EbsC (Cys-tRNA(Pro) deacylase)